MSSTTDGALAAKRKSDIAEKEAEKEVKHDSTKEVIKKKIEVQKVVKEEAKRPGRPKAAAKNPQEDKDIPVQ